MVYAAQGGVAIFVCATSVHSNPAASVTWTDNNGRAIDVGGARFNLTDLSLSISEVALADEGVWMCIVTVAGVGEARHSPELVVVGKFVFIIL